jgi:protease-4
VFGGLCGGVLMMIFGGDEEGLLGEAAGNRISEEVITPAAFGTKKKIAVIDVKGVILSGGSMRSADSRRITFELAAARRDPDVVAIVLDMNTPGGEVTASDEIHREVLRCRDSGKPVVTCMRSIGASGGYYIAAGSNWIVANRLTLTGSIGVIISTVNYKELFTKIGLRSEVYRSGEMKDMLSGARDRRPEEAAYVQSLVRETFREFAAVEAAGRKRYRTPEAVMTSPFGDGRILSGTRALEFGLVDQLGYFEDAVDRARELSGTPNVKVVRFRRAVGFLDRLLSMKASNRLDLNGLLPAELRCLEPGRLYFLVPPGEMNLEDR